VVDEDEVVEITTFGAEARNFILIGLDLAMVNARSAYIKGRIDVEEFEAEVGRLLRRRAEVRKRLP
jgi:hypothetical protein